MKKEQNKTPIWTTLYEYCNKKITYFDVPGHKKDFHANRMANVLIDTYKYDVNSSPEVDNLAHPEGPINEGLKLLAKAFGGDQAYILTNGTTQGIHTLIASSVYPGEKILIPRNSHKSVINGIIIAGAIPVFVNPVFDEKYGIAHNITLAELKKVYKKNPDAKALLLLNPTYFGVVTNVKQIAKFCHDNKLIFLADEAHGAHFNFHSSLPRSSLSAGADGVAVSFHKTLGSLTQSSVLVWKEKNNYLQSKYVWQWNSILTTTSPSFLLMASVDAARQMLVCKGNELLTKALELARYARKELKKIDGIDVLSNEDIGFPGAYRLDETKLLIKVDEIGYTGFEFYEELRVNYNIQLELGETKTCMALVSFNDNKASIDFLIKAIRDIAENKKREKLSFINFSPFLETPKRLFTPRETITKHLEEISIYESIGRVAGDSLMYYPPGIPLVLPGEVITQEILDFYKKLLVRKARVISAASSVEMILVVKDIMLNE